MLFDDCDEEEIARAELNAWWPKLASNGVALFHGLDLQRPRPPRLAWDEMMAQHPSAEFHEGIGLGLVAMTLEQDPLLAEVLGSSQRRAELATLYRLVALRIDAEGRASAAEKKNAALELRQIWLDTLLADRWQAQEVMDNQAREIADRPKAFEELRRDRMKAQLIMETQAEQLKQWVAKSEALHRENKKLKKHLAEEKKKKRSVPERILREIGRIPRNLLRAKTAPASKSKRSRRRRKRSIHIANGSC